MKNTLRLFLATVIVAVALATSAFAQSTYLGRLSANTVDAESVSNPYGTYGSRYSPTSINNPYSTYGSSYSAISPTNLYSSQAPLIFGERP